MRRLVVVVVVVVMVVVVVAVAGCGDDGATAAPASLLAWYPMDDLIDMRATDASGNGRHGTCTTCPGVVTGKSLAAYRFGGGDRIDVPLDPALQTTGGFSAAAWIFLDDAPASTGCAIGKGSAWKLCITPQRLVQFDATMSTAMVSLGVWHHVAGTWDGTTQRIYLDGAEVAVQDAPVTFDNLGLAIGQAFAGTIDEPRVYAGALTPIEVAALAAE